MAFKRRGYRKRGFKRRRGYGKSSIWSLAKKAAQGVVKYYLNPEYKFLESVNQFSLTTTGLIASDMSLIGQGDTASTRDGNSIKVTSWLFRYILNVDPAATSSRVRILAFYDISSAGAVPNLTDVIDTSSVLSPMNKLNGSRFKVIFDRTHVVDQTTKQKAFKVFKKMQHHIKYLDTTSAQSSLGQGPIYVLALSNETTHPVIWNYNSRMRFLDN